MQRTTIAMLALGSLIILSVIFYSSRRESRPARSGNVQVVAGSGASPLVRSAGEHTAGEAPSAVASSTADVERLVATSFPALRDIATRCDGPRCEISASTAVPPGGSELTRYEHMVREGLEATLRAHGHAVADRVQIEELGGDEVRLRLTVTT